MLIELWHTPDTREARNEQRKLRAAIANALAVTLVGTAMIGKLVNPQVANLLTDPIRFGMVIGGLGMHFFLGAEIGRQAMTSLPNLLPEAGFTLGQVWQSVCVAAVAAGVLGGVQWIKVWLERRSAERAPRSEPPHTPAV